jgi:hypothetical protein
MAAFPGGQPKTTAARRRAAMFALTTPIRAHPSRIGANPGSA